MRQSPGRSCWQRVLALCLAVWFVAVATDLPVAHACAMHGRGAHTVAATGHDGAHHADVAGVRHDGTPHAAAPSATTSDAGAHHTSAHAGRAGREGGAPTACTCLGQCCAAALVAAPHVAVVPGGHAGASAPPTPGRPQHEYVAAWVDFVLPFSTAPPPGVTV